MAQPLENRITAALRSSSRIKDVESTIADVVTEIGSTQKKYDGEQARSIDPALTTPEAREARNNAADLEHDIRRLNASLELLNARRQTILDDESYAKRVARFELARKNRDEIALHVRRRYPALALELVDMAKRLKASDEEIRIANADRPRGEAALVGAENMARGLTAYTWPMDKGGSPVRYIPQAVVPLLGRDGYYLPLPDRNEMGGQGRIDAMPAIIAADLAFAQCPIEGIALESASIASEAANA